MRFNLSAKLFRRAADVHHLPAGRDRSRPPFSSKYWLTKAPDCVLGRRKSQIQIVGATKGSKSIFELVGVFVKHIFAAKF
jgi:hypothetical protein